MSGPCLSSSVTDHPLRPATRRSLGEPLPHQLADRSRAHLKAAPEGTLYIYAHEVLNPVSQDYPSL